MAEQRTSSPGQHHGAKQNGEKPIPPWLPPIMRSCRSLAVPCLAISGVLFAAVAIVTLSGIARDAAWYPQLLTAFGIFLILGFTTLFVGRLHMYDAGVAGLLFGLLLFFSPYGLAYLVAEQFVFGIDALIPVYASYAANFGVTLSILAVMCLMTQYIFWFDQRRRKRLRSMMVRSSDGKVAFDIAKSPTAVDPTTGVSNYEAPSYIPKCWEMSRCRKQVRVVCPNYVDRTNCWQRRCGCLCDREFATFLVDTFSTPEAQAAVKTDRVASVPGIVTMRERLKRFQKERRWSAHAKLCYACAVFLEHQEYKYRHLNWIGFPVTLAVAAVLYPLYHEAYNLVAGQMDNVARQLFLVIKLPDNFQPDASMLVNSPFEYIFLFALTVLLASIVFDFTDRCLLKWHL